MRRSVKKRPNTSSSTMVIRVIQNLVMAAKMAIQRRMEISLTVLNRVNIIEKIKQILMTKMRGNMRCFGNI